MASQQSMDEVQQGVEAIKVESDAKTKQRKPKKEKKPKKMQPAKSEKKSREGMEYAKDANFPEWYQEVVQKAGMIEFYDISGCYILRPWSCAMWDFIRDYIDRSIKRMGVENGYFPLFVSRSRLEKEKDHVEGFAAEVAWVTKSGSSELEDPIAVRPTSETIMYPAFAKWIRSHRDLPLKINQWSNVVRWEFKHPTPFIRSREFLWQEGHTAFATREEADVEVREILDLYKSVYEDLLAVPVIQGQKSEKEKFAGGLYTTTVEGYIPATGRAIQGGTSHGLGQNFAKMFDIVFESESSEGTAQRLHAWQNSWGMTTRTIGVMVMVHGDDKGLVLPPRIAPVQVVLVPIVKKGKEEIVRDEADRLNKLLSAGAPDLRIKVDSRLDKSPGWKFNFWELKGVPLRVEFGPLNIDAGTVDVAVRLDGNKITLPADDALPSKLLEVLDEVQARMLSQARDIRDSRVTKAVTWEEFMAGLRVGNMVLSPWCNETSCEESVKKRSGEESGGDADARALSGSAKTLCLPFDAELTRLGVQALQESTACFACEKCAKAHCLWGRSY